MAQNSQTGFKKMVRTFSVIAFRHLIQRQTSIDAGLGFSFHYQSEKCHTFVTQSTETIWHYVLTYWLNLL